MRKGKGELTYHQLKMINKRLNRQNIDLIRQLEKLQHDYNSLKTAHNKLLVETKSDGAKKQVSSAYGSVGQPKASSPGFMW